MQNIKIDGISNFTGGEYQTISVDGIAKCDGDINADTINIDGKFKCKGSITAGLLDCDGMAEFKSNIRVKKLISNGIIRVTDGTKIEAEEIYCDGMISINGQISADTLKANGYISAKEIVGDNILIKSKIGKVWNLVSKFFNKFESKVDLIEATTIELYGVQAKSVNGENIIIGAECEIDNLDCSGTLTINEKATVKNITGKYSMLK